MSTLARQDQPAVPVTSTMLQAGQPVTLKLSIFEDPLNRSKLYTAATGKKMEVPSSTEEAVNLIPESLLHGPDGWLSYMRATSFVRQKCGPTKVVIQITVGNCAPVLIGLDSYEIEVLPEVRLVGDQESYMLGEVYERKVQAGLPIDQTPTDPWKGSYRSDEPKVRSKGGGGASKKAA